MPDKSKGKLGEDLRKRFDTLQTRRSGWDSTWQAVIDHCAERKGRVVANSKSYGPHKTRYQYDSTASRSSNILAAGLHGHLTSPNAPWFTLKVDDIALMENRAVKEWLAEVEKILYDVFHDSNWNAQIHEFYMEIVLFGTAVLYMEHDDEEGKYVRFYSRPISECYICENSKKLVDTVFRKFAFTARQAKQEFGKDNLSDRIVNALKDEPDKEFDFIHAVFPREDYDKSKLDTGNMPFASIYMEYETKKIVKEGGYREFPFAVTRWLKETGEVYGRSPAIDALPDIRTINEVSKQLLKATQKLVSPPLLVPDDGFISPVKMIPDGINFYRAGTKDRIETIKIEGNLPVGYKELETRIESIRQAFFTDLFLMLVERPQMTATEVLKRVEEKLIVIGPSLSRLQTEVLQPVIKRVYNLLKRQGKIPNVPMELQDERITIEYTSPLAKAQRAHFNKAIAEVIQYNLPMIQLKPDMLDNIDTDKLVRESWELYGAPITILRPFEDVEKIREQRAEAMQNEEAKDDVDRMTGAAKTLGDTDVDNLGKLLGGA